MAVSYNWDLAGSPNWSSLELFHLDTHTHTHMQLLPGKEAAKELFDLKLVQKTKHRILIDKERGYACCPVAELPSTL